MMLRGHRTRALLLPLPTMALPAAAPALGVAHRQMSSDSGQKPPGDAKEPLTKLWHTLRGLWKLNNAGPDLSAKLVARQEASRMYAERQQAAQDAITRRITEKFEGNL